MKKKIFFTAAVAAALFTGYSAYDAQRSLGMDDTLLANVEALADNESDTNLLCQGLLGSCKFNCEDCGFTWSAIGSHVVGSHKCSQSK